MFFLDILHKFRRLQYSTTSIERLQKVVSQRGQNTIVHARATSIARDYANTVGANSKRLGESEHAVVAR